MHTDDAIRGMNRQDTKDAKGDKKFLGELGDLAVKNY
jgi:hypothetical protein